MYRHLLGFEPAMPRDVTIHRRECDVCGLQFYDPSVVGDESLYASLERASEYYMAGKAEFRVALEYLSPGAKVLEVGAGAGEFGLRVDGRNYVGLETNPSAASLARSKGLDVRTQTLDQHLDALEADGYDAVCAFQVLEHVEDPRSMLEQMLRALRPSGYLVVAVPNDESFISLERNSILNMPPHHQTRWRPRCLSYLSKILPVKMVSLEREALADYHVNPYLNTLFAEAIDRLLRRKRSELDWFHASLPMRALRRVACLPLRAAFSDERLRAVGHTMVAVMAKNETSAG
jgi:SAM-dependent methyltransferase